MSACIRCEQPVEPGQFYLTVEYDPKDPNDALRQDFERAGTWTAKSPYRMHVDCPDVVAEEDLRVDVYRPGGVRVTHIPTGIVVTVSDVDEPSALRAKRLALKEIRRRLDEKEQP